MAEGDGGEDGLFDVVADVPEVPWVVAEEVVEGGAGDLFVGLDEGVVEGEVVEDGVEGVGGLGAVGVEEVVEVGDEGEEFGGDGFA